MLIVKQAQTFMLLSGVNFTNLENETFVFRKKNNFLANVFLLVLEHFYLESPRSTIIINCATSWSLEFYKFVGYFLDI